MNLASFKFLFHKNLQLTHTYSGFSTTKFANDVLEILRALGEVTWVYNICQFYKSLHCTLSIFPILQWLSENLKGYLIPIPQKLATFSTIQSSDLSPDGSQIGRPSRRRIFHLVPPPLHWWHHGGQRDRPGFRTKAATACATFALPGPYLHKSAFALKLSIGFFFIIR